MQRLFSTFPGGRPGAALLLVRVVVGGILLVVGGTSVANAGAWTLAAGIMAGLSGLALVIGFVTPFAVGAALLATAFMLFGPDAGPSIHISGTLAAVLVIVIFTAIALLGPGAFSLDARLFGRREINIPRAAPEKEEPR